MSGRIRTVKPEWLEDELLVMCSANARVLSISLILLADDYGNGRAHPALLRSRSLPLATPPEFKAAFDELVSIRFITTYEVSGQQYYSIRTWAKHQRVDKPGKPRVPGPDEGSPVLEETKRAYFIRGATTGLIKIGQSIDPVARLSELARTAPERYELLAVGGAEREHHVAFAEFRVSGEWFQPAPAILAKIRELGGNPDSPIATAGCNGTQRTLEVGGAAAHPEQRGIPPAAPENIPGTPAPDRDHDPDPDLDLRPRPRRERAGAREALESSEAPTLSGIVEAAYATALGAVGASYVANPSRDVGHWRSAADGVEALKRPEESFREAAERLTLEYVRERRSRSPEWFAEWLQRLAAKTPAQVLGGYSSVSTNHESSDIEDATPEELEAFEKRSLRRALHG